MTDTPKDLPDDQQPEDRKPEPPQGNWNAHIAAMAHLAVGIAIIYPDEAILLSLVLTLLQFYRR